LRELIYQIFVDRYAGKDGAELAVPAGGGDPWSVHAGGTLDGVTAKLDHIQSLGAGAIYLTPIFRAGSNHKYDTSSFDDVDERFGGIEAFERLAEACRARGLGLILDGVFNHTGDRHPWFTEEKPGFYRPGSFWRGYRSLPELDLSSVPVLQEIDRIVEEWLRRGATGWRLDCANDLGFSACARIARVAREAGAKDGVIGEVMTYAEEWMREGYLDGVMNYWFRETALGLAKGEVPAIQAAANLETLAARTRSEALLRSWNIVSTHDTPRLASVLPDRAARHLALALAFTTPGTPLLYYGEEIGMNGGADPDNRRPMIWDEARWDRETLELVRTLASLRKKHRALSVGTYLPLPNPGTPDLLAFARTTSMPSDVRVIVANGSARPLTARVFAPYSHLFDHLPLVDLLGRSAPLHVLAGRFDVALAPHQLAIFAPDDTTIPGYRFFRPR
jgi:alpha-glucosidase